MRPLLTRSVLLVAAFAGAPAWAQPAPRLILPASTRLLIAHNEERAAWNLPPLTWDAGLAAGAEDYAVTMARTGRWGHSSREARVGSGENLWMGTRGAFTVEQMIGGWISERTLFRPGVFPNVSVNGDWSAVGHYTQMIWPTTTRVGCAIRSSRSSDYLVCRYASAGNINGRRVP